MNGRKGRGQYRRRMQLTPRPDSGMFDHEIWRRQIAERLSNFARNPRQELQLAGSPGLLCYLVARTFEPFLEAFQNEPIAAVLSLAAITCGPGADQIVRRAIRFRYQSAAQVDRELRASHDIRLAVEQLLIALRTISFVQQRLNESREDWFRLTLSHELNAFPGEFLELRRTFVDTSWQSRVEMFRELRKRKGYYTPADLVLIQDGLGDSAAQVRATAARMIGLITELPSAQLTRTLVRVALHDSDAETRFAAARSLGMLREHVTSPQLLDHLSACLFDEDAFVRSAAALTLGQLGELASAPMLVRNLARLLIDQDPYTREAAARALGQIGPSAANPEVLAALASAAQDSDPNVHEAASETLVHLQSLHTATPLQLAAGM